MLSNKHNTDTVFKILNKKSKILLAIEKSSNIVVCHMAFYIRPKFV